MILFLAIPGWPTPPRCSEKHLCALGFLCGHSFPGSREDSKKRIPPLENDPRAAEIREGAERMK